VSTTDADLNELAHDAAAEFGIAGAQVSMLHRRTITEGVAGVANVESGLPVTPDTLFQVASTTKILTAALVMRLVAEGRIGLDVPVVEQLPGFALADRQALAMVTPRHLMSMSSGIDNGPYTDYGRGDDALTRYVAALADLPHVFLPGQGYGYSNASTCVSGRLVEHVTGQTWDDALRTRLLEPAGLRDSETVTEKVLTRRYALGHVLDGTGRLALRTRWSLPRSMGPAGATLCSTATDLVRLGHLFLHDGASLDGTEVLPPHIVNAMQNREAIVPPTLLAQWWGLGPYGNVWDGVEVMGHSGTTLGGSSYLLWARERDIAIATIVNTPEFGYPFAARVFCELFHTVAGISVPGKPEPPENVEVDVNRLVGTYKMQALTLTVSASNGGLSIAGLSDLPTTDDREIAPSALVPLTPTTFLPTNPAIDGRRGWALAFLGPEDAPATHLVNGCFNLRRTSG